MAARLKLRNGPADPEQIWCVCVYGDQAAMHITQIMGGVHLHLLTCARADVSLLGISETAGWIALKFGMWLEIH